MKLGIVTDSTCDLPQNLIEDHELEVVPTILIIDGVEYADGEGISRADFYTRLPAMKTPPTTAAPSIGEFTIRYQMLFEKGCQHVLSIHAATQLSAIYNTAQQAASEFNEQITVLDSGSLSLGLGFQVLAAAEAAENGLPAALSAVESARKRMQFYAALDTMDNVRRSGRVPFMVGALGGLLSIKPVIQLVDGVIKPIGAVRTTAQANERMASLLRACGTMKQLAILHTGAGARAKEFLNRMMGEISQALPRNIRMLNVTPVIGAHVGPNGLGFVAIRA